MYNGAVKRRNTVLARWSDVETQYQRRADLIPNFVEVVKGYARHERGVFESVTDARAKASQIQLDITNITPEQMAQYQAVQGELTQTLSRLLLVAENYPELKANQAFLNLQAQLAETENWILAARNRFNEAARDYKTHIESFPTNVILDKITHGKFEPIPFFESSPGTDQVPKINL